MNMRFIAFVGLSLCAVTATAEEPELFELSIEELMQIPITAAKREQQWVDVAATVDIYDGALLRSNHINHFRELAERAPGLVFGRVGNTPNIYLRGIGSDLMSVAADASTAVYQDDVYLARPEMALAHFWDIERIEILKGPQGALYGRNATGGAINIIRARPSFERQQAYGHLAAGSFSRRQLETAYGTPLGDESAVRASFLAIQDQGYTEDLDPRGGDELDDNRVVAGRIEWRWRGNEQLESSLTASHYQNNNNGFSLTPADQRGLADQLGALPAPDFHQIRNDLPTFSDYQTQGISWRLDWQGQAFDLQSISAYRNLDSRYLLNTDGTEIPVTESQVIWSQHQRSQELRLVSSEPGDWQWLLGASWLDESPRLDVGLVRHPLANSIIINALAETRAWGFYGELSWAFQPEWKLKLGLRDTREERQHANRLLRSGDLLGLDSPLTQAQSIGSSAETQRFDNLSPQLVLDFSPRATAADDLWYLSVTEGFKSGGANSLSTRPGFKAEQIVSLESGYKYQRGDLLLHIAGFHYDYKDLQVITYEAGATSITNAASASIKGVDSGFVWSPSQHWQYQLALTYLDAHYDRFITSLASAPRDVSGNPMPFAPSWDLNQVLELHLQQNWRISLHHHYQTRTFFNQFADETIASDKRHLLDLRLVYKLNKHWEFATAVHNLTDQHYYQNLTRFTSTSPTSVPEGNALGVTAPGRQWLLEANYHY